MKIISQFLLSNIMPAKNAGGALGDRLSGSPPVDMAMDDKIFILEINWKNDWRVLLLPDDKRIKKRSLPCG